MRHPILWVFIAVAAGVLLADGSAAPAWLWLILLGLAAAATAGAARARRGTALSALVTLVFAGAGAAALTTAPAPLEAACADGLWRGRIAAPLEREIQAETGRISQRTVLALVAERCGELWEARSGRVEASLWGDAPLARGDVVELRLRLSRFEPPRNRTDRDARDRARSGQLAARAAVLSPSVVLEHGSGPLAALDRLRRGAALAFERHLPHDVAALAKAFVIGDEGALTPTLREAWSDSGTAHLLAISGLQVALMALALFGLTKRLLVLVPGAGERFSIRRVAAALALPAIVAFCAWSGGSPSAVRATVMAAAALIGLIVGRASAVPNALGIAGVGMLLWDPTSLYDVGFLLSFAGVVALLVAPRVDGTRHIAVRLLAGAAIASVAATLVTAPILAWRFGRLSLVAPLVNMVAVPVGNLVCVPLGFSFLAAAAVSDAAAAALAAPLGLALRALNALSSWTASLPFSAVDLPRPRAVEIAAWVTLLVSAALPLRKRAGLAAALGAATLLVAIGVRCVERAGDGRLHVIHPYVGQGDAAVAVLPEGGVVLFDAGGAFDPGDWDPGRAVVAPLLRRLGARRIDLAIVSHAHPDHLGGFAYLSRRFPIDELWWSGAGADVSAMQDLVQQVRQGGGAVRLVSELPTVVEREGVRFEVVHPRPPPATAEGLTWYPEMHLNDNSIVLIMRHGERSLLLPGDAEHAAEALLAASLSPVDVMKSPHHGSKTSSTEPWMSALRPSVVVVSVGERNPFGFPNQEVLERYAAYGSHVFRTDEHGAVEMVSDGARWTVRAAGGRVVRVDSAREAPPISGP